MFFSYAKMMKWVGTSLWVLFKADLQSELGDRDLFICAEIPGRTSEEVVG